MSNLAVLGMVECIPPRTLDVKLFYYLRTSPLVINNWAANLTTKTNIISGVAFMLAILSFVALGLVNFNKQQYTNKKVVTTMSDKKGKTVAINEGASTPKMQKVNTGREKAGATIPKPSATKSVKKEITPTKKD